MPTQHINPEGVGQPTGYTHVVASDGRRIVFVSGQVAQNQKGEPVAVDDLGGQAAQVFANLKSCLEAAGASFNDVTKLTTYVVNYQQENRAVIGEARQRYLPAEPPASTLVGVQALARPEYMIEIEAIAVLP